MQVHRPAYDELSVSSARSMHQLVKLSKTHMFLVSLPVISMGKERFEEFLSRKDNRKFIELLTSMTYCGRVGEDNIRFVGGSVSPRGSVHMDVTFVTVKDQLVLLSVDLREELSHEHVATGLSLLVDVHEMVLGYLNPFWEVLGEPRDGKEFFIVDIRDIGYGVFKDQQEAVNFWCKNAHG